jgi:hypothetical protein
LDDILTHSPNATLNTSTRAKEQLTAAVHPRNLRWYESEARPQKYRDAASHLQHILKDDTQVCEKVNHSSMKDYFSGFSIYELLKCHIKLPKFAVVIASS